ncbi:hypothetical protein ENUP19_0187G0005 [Entamoeba nuttalli]|uniref:Leucine rich repeat protein, BspA family protein n=1 Tax=Entamoeba nuttalli TaxID=412467 RepID=A0ABQ0DN54_9EUKA
MKIGYNEIMIVSKYFEDINDFINLEIGIKRFRGNLERFHFNPIPLNQYSRKLFPNIETFHIYNKEDEIFNDGRIFKYVIWYKVNYSTYLEEKKEMNEYKISNLQKKIEINMEIQYQKKLHHLEIEIKIPTSVSEIGNELFKCCSSLRTINIPSSVIELGDGCFKECTSLTSITIPTSVSEIGKYCFYECTSLKSINIPSSITSFGNKCFYHCRCEEELKKNKTIPKYCFEKYQG